MNRKKGNFMVCVVVLAAGMGSRMVSSTPKILHELGGQSMIRYVLQATAPFLSPDTPHRIVLSPQIAYAFCHPSYPSLSIATQEKPLGTGDAARVAMTDFGSPEDDVLIVCGDTPLLTPEDLQPIIEARTAYPNEILVGAFHETGPHTYGRIKLSGDGLIDRVIEASDAAPEDLKISLCNSGVYLIKKAHLMQELEKLSCDNKQGEFYLTDILAGSIPARPILVSAENFQGVNTRRDLMQAEKALQRRWRDRALDQGATLVDDDSVFFSHDTVIGQDVIIEPNVFFGPGVSIGNHVRVLSFCRIARTRIEDHAEVGPFAHLRDGNVIGHHATIGNFVEIKKSTIGAHTKVKHLSYLGDANLGERVNVGAGTITCNHNGFVKSMTMIEDDAYIGSGSCLVAPVSIGVGAIVAAGSVIDEDVPSDALAISRNRQQNKSEWASSFRSKASIVFKGIKG